MKDLSLSEPVVILGNGPFPENSVVLDLIKRSETRICLDGGADKLQNAGMEPDLIIGDMDSTDLVNNPNTSRLEHTPDQSKSDLEKALDWCLQRDVTSITLTGITGGRDDHSFANLLILHKFSDKMDLEILSDNSRISCLIGSRKFKSFKGQMVSIIPVKKVSRITTDGLEYSLKDEQLDTGTRGLSNVSSGSTFTISTSDPIWVFRSLET